jgi:hypothetical protein
LRDLHPVRTGAGIRDGLQRQSPRSRKNCYDRRVSRSLAETLLGGKDRLKACRVHVHRLKPVEISK